MATLFRKPRSPFWWVAFFDSGGRRRYRSTKKRVKSEAVVVGAEWEVRARRQTPEDGEKRQRILRLVEEAADLALRGTLTAASAQAIVNRILEASTGEALRQEGIADWFRGWLQEKKTAKSNGTFVRYAGVIEAFLESLSPERRSQPLAALSVSDIRRFRDRFLEEGRTATTVNIAMKVIRGPLNAARRQGLIISNPAEALEAVSSDSAEKGVFSPRDVARLCEAAAGGDWKGLILGGYYTGARLGDLVNLRWSAINFERGSVAFGQRKTGKFIEIPLHPEFAKWLQECPPGDPVQPVFPAFAGRTSGGKSGLSGQFKRLMKRAGIETSVTEKRGKMGRNRVSLSFHSLRHSFNSAMANAGVSQEVRQRLTGHASKAVNDRYTRTELATLRRAVEAVSGLDEIQTNHAMEPAVD